MYDIDDNWDDSPLESSKGDELGHERFADSIAKCILSINKTKGGAVAIRGPWGSGKSSVINMVLNQLKEEKPKHLVAIRFSSWCYRSEDEIVAGFFQELYAGLKSNIGNKQTDLRSLATLGARIVGVTKVVASGLKVAAPSADALISAGQSLLENVIAQDKSIESLQNDVSDIVGKLNKKILFVIDDIDRLSPDEAIAIFRVIKSVGRLKNVIYLLSYDRVATENAIEKKYPSEGGRYLEKITQASFDLPEPSSSQLNKILMSRFSKIFKSATEFRYTDRKVQDIIISETGTPRGVHQLANAISVTFPSVDKNVNIEDFVIIETLRLFRPSVYQKIQENKNAFFESPEYLEDENSQPHYKEIEDIVIGEESEADRSKLSHLLNRLFPLLTSDSQDLDSLNREKRVCSKSHFDTYFRFAVSIDAVSHVEFGNFVKRAGNRKFVEKKLTKDSNESYNESKVESLFNEIENNLDLFNIEDIGPFLISLYSIADRFHASSNFSDSYSRSRSNRDRIVGLSYRSLRLLNDSDKVSKIIYKVCENSPLDLLLELCARTFRGYELNDRMRKQNMRKQNMNRNFMKRKDIDEFASVVLGRIEKHASSKLFPDFGSLNKFLDNWDTISSDRQKIRDTFRIILGQSSENIITAAKGFSVSFTKLDAKMRHSRFEIDRISRFIDSQHFLIKLFEVSKDSSIGAQERDIVNEVFKVLNEYDERHGYRRLRARR